MDDNEEHASSLISPDPRTSISSSYEQDPHLSNYFVQSSFTNSSTTADLLYNQEFPTSTMTKSNSYLSISKSEETKEIEKPEESVEGPHDQKILFSGYFDYYNNASDDFEEDLIEQFQFDGNISY